MGDLFVPVEVDDEWVFIPEGTDSDQRAIPVLHADAPDFVLVTVESYFLDGEGVLSTEQEGIATITSNAKVGDPQSLIDEIEMLLHR